MQHVQPAATVRRGRWQYYPDLQFWSARGAAWQLEDTGWWLRKRTGSDGMFKWCNYYYCYRPPYSWWQLYRCQPREWLIKTPPRLYARANEKYGELFAWPAAWQPGHGECTHRHLLKDAMTAVEAAYDEHVLKALANIGSSRARVV